MQLSLADDQPLLSAEPPADEELFGLAPDPASDPPDDPDAWLRDLTEPERDAYLATTQLPPRQRVFEAGFLPRDVGLGAGFAGGGVLDRLPAGPVLGQFAADAWAQGLAGATDDELIGVLAAWRRLTSWASAGEAAAVTELTERRRSQGLAGGDPDLMEYLPDELAAALTLTKRAASGVLDFACGLARLPCTGAALARGDIDRPKALVLVNEMCGVSDELAATIEEQVIGAAPTQTTGQLLASTRRAVLAADPAAAVRRREKAQRDARVEVWTEQSGTATLAGRDLPPADALAADQRIDALARQLKADGAIGSLPQLRARVYTALLLGESVKSLRPSALSSPSARPPSPGLAGSVNLTMPLSSLLGTAGAPGEVPGFGPLDASACRTLAAALASRPGNRWCLTITDSSGHAVGHGCTRQAPHGSGWALLIEITDLGSALCRPDQGQHRDDHAGYRPSRRLRHLIETRHRTCVFRSCRRAATRCDVDHTVPYHLGGATCRCNLAPLCRRHHQAKQTRGWQLSQPEPGQLVWRLPHGRSYRIRPDPYPVS